MLFKQDSQTHLTCKSVNFDSGNLEMNCGCNYDIVRN